MASRLKAPLPAGVAALVLALTGCGGGGDEPTSPGGFYEEGEEGASEEEREIAERDEAAAEIPEADRVAYYQLATASGLLHARALAEEDGEEIPPDSTDAGLEAAADRLDRLRPENGDFDRLAGQLQAGIAAQLNEPGEPGVRVALGVVARVNRALDEYADDEPLIAVFVPD